MPVIYELLGQKVVTELLADAAISQANPVSGQKYLVLAETQNVMVYGAATKITWATTQPTPLELFITVDGVEINHKQGNPVSGTWYYANRSMAAAMNNQGHTTTAAVGGYNSFLWEGRSVKVEAEITWATTQPTPLEARVKYAKW